MKLGLIFEKAWNRFYSKHVIPRLEKSFLAEDGETLHYLFYPERDSKVLIVVLQAFHPDGPRYNYVATLSGVKANRLYIKDDFVPYTGNFYLGRSGNYNIEADVHALIRRTAEACGAEKLIFVGSSKGGGCAVNFGSAYPGSAIIVAAPMYHSGTYMFETKKFNPALADVLGEPVTQEKIAALDKRLADKIRLDPYGATQRAYLHCSRKDKTYTKHLIDLMDDMKQAGITIDLDEGDYEGHENLKWYFPAYLKASVAKEIEGL